MAYMTCDVSKDGSQIVIKFVGDGQDDDETCGMIVLMKDGLDPDILYANMYLPMLGIEEHGAKLRFCEE